MSVGTYLSGTGHAALVVWMVAGWGMSSDPLPFEVTEVSVVTGAEFAALTQGSQPDVPPSEPVAVQDPVVEDTPPAPVVETPPEPVTPPAPEAPPTPPTPEAAPETPPDPIVPDPVLPDPVVPDPVEPDTPPELPDTPTIIAPPPSAEIGSSPRPVPRPADRVASDIVAPPPPDATQSDDITAAATDDIEAPVQEDVAPDEETTAPQEAADQIVTEAEDPSFAPEISSRPQTRPQRAVAQTPTEDAVDPVAAALAAAGAGTPATPPTEPTPPTAPTPGLGGGDISDGQKADLRREIRGCWSVGSASTAVLNTRVTIEWNMNPDGTIDGGSFDMVGFEGGSQSDANIAFRIARSAIAQCVRHNGRNGYTLPQEEFQNVRRLRLTFDPEQMRLR